MPLTNLVTSKDAIQSIAVDGYSEYTRNIDGTEKGIVSEETISPIETDAKSDAIRRFRRTVESTDIGRWVVENHLDRHLYTVLEPTVDEDRKRINNVIKIMSPTQLETMNIVLDGFLKRNNVKRDL